MKIKRLVLCAAVFFVLLAAVALVWTLRQKDNTESVELEYRVVFENVDSEFADKIKVGDGVVHSRSQSLLGYVTEVDVSENYYVYELDSDRVIKREYPDKYNLAVKITADAEYIKGVGCSISGIRIAVGVPLELRSPSFVGQAYCTDIEWREKADE